jgi:anaerobic sulfite reductase subunit A
MKLNEYFAEILYARQTMYRFLSGIFMKELDDAAIDSLKKGNLNSPIGDENEDYASMQNGCDMINDFLKGERLNVKLDLAVDYARVFLGAGVVRTTNTAFPYESVYTGKERMIMQDARDQVVAIYRENGLDVPKGLDIPEDHLGYEFDFMAHLCGKCVEFAESEDLDLLVTTLKVQADFINKHLLNWLPGFCNDVRKFAETDFYKGIAYVTESFVQIDLNVLSDLLDEVTETLSL